jgi:hypothetical protein
MNKNDEALLFKDEVFQIVGCAIEVNRLPSTLGGSENPLGSLK